MIGSRRPVFVPARKFLFACRNPTGVAQVLEEYVNATLKNVFTIGHDVIAQTDVTNPLAQVVHTLLSDGHGSTRTLLDELNAIVQQYAYDAYGNMLAAAGLTTAAMALTNLLYSGEWTMKSGQQYLRARIYDPASGTFNRLDPYSGNLADPQSLHKYLYAHANPVAYSDPSGHFAEPLLLAGQSGGTTSWVRAMTSGVIGAVFARGEAFARTLYLTGDINAAEDAAADAAAAGFAMGLAVGMLEGRLTPYIGVAAFGFGLAQAKQEWEAGHHALATLDFTLAIFSFFTGVYRPLAMPVRGAVRLPTATINASPANGLRTWRQAGLTESQARRIQNAATRTGQRIDVVGGRARGKQTGDWDYIMYGKSSQRHSASGSVPRGDSGGSATSTGWSGQDVWQSYNPDTQMYATLDPSLPHVTFLPGGGS